MSTHCQYMRNLAADAVNGTLDAALARQLEAHLAECPECRNYYEALKCEDRLLGRLVEEIDEGMAGRQQRLVSVFEKHQHRQTERRTWRYTMRSPMTKMAAAAVIVAAVVLGVVLFPSGNVTWAGVVEPILKAKTVIIDLVIGTGEDSPSMHEIIVGTRIRRTLSNMPNLTQVLDLEAGRMLVLDNETKTAAYVDIQGMVQQGTRNYVEFVRQVILQVQEGQVEKLGEQVIEGQRAVGFTGRGKNEAVTIWADAQTGYPIRVEFNVGQGFAAVMKNFEFDVPIDAAMVSMDAPEGYTVAPANLDMTNATEADFIESLRIWAEIIGDGVFPEAIGSEQTMKQMPVLVQKMIARNIPEAEGVKLGMDFGRGMVFHQMLNAQGKWAYTGAGVKFGDAEKTVFWYQPQGSATYRVIYGDLSVKDVAANDLPK